ncbi:PurD Phosphoribosylamine-glycine ligase [uncultured Caudovirales phage]|uniref:PurD Phosphoribosylamine-glycine ligase n=1 Tax=uncultured Caudovirales phage TaxID=2100421 RepID=A0A6J5TAH3_9CAUD|nr:PurD Phosphoribosylamine-glycine ligase [uncultured Caudovirales phage]
MKIAVFGGNAAAHFIAQKLLEDPTVEVVYHFNANHANVPTTRYQPIVGSGPELFAFLETTPIDLIVPTVLQFQTWTKLQAKIKELKIPVLMPTENLALLEWSKITGKRLLGRLKIPTAPFRILGADFFFAEYFNIKRPFVVKFERDWRAGLQTIIVTDDNYKEEFETFKANGTQRFMTQFGEFKSQAFLIEEFVEGIREYSYHALCNETGWTYLGSARDYKKFGDGDTGFNTASMGSYAPIEHVDPIIDEYVTRIVNHCKEIGTPYIGVLYLGILVQTDGTPIVLEINTRTGDPEIQPILNILDDSMNIADLFYKTATNQPLPVVKFAENRFAVSVRLVHKDYRDNVEDGITLEGKDAFAVNPTLWPIESDIYVSLNRKRSLLNAVVTTTSEYSVEHAADKVYKFLSNKTMYDYTYRKDVGYLK